MTNVTRLQTEEHVARLAPGRLMRPCDYGLLGAIHALETQLGSIEAYNRLVDAAAALRAKIDAGQAEAQNPMFRTNLGFHPAAR